MNRVVKIVKAGKKEAVENVVKVSQKVEKAEIVKTVSTWISENRVRKEEERENAYRFLRGELSATPA